MLKLSISLEFPDEKANELEGLLSMLTSLGGKAISVKGAKSPTPPVRKTKKQIQDQVKAKLHKKYNNQL